MLTRHFRGTTEQNNALTLANGQLSIDLERKAVRLHDGATLGGFEMVGTQAYVPPVGPGPETLVAGDATAGFYGEVLAEDFITGSDLATAVGLSAGTLQYDTTSWLKFSLDGEIVFVPKKPIRYGVSWSAIHGVNAVYNDVSASTLQIGEDTLRVTLLSGGDADPASGAGGEWNRLMYPVHASDPTGLGWGINYLDAEIGVGTDFGNGRTSWVQEAYVDPTTNRVGRGRNDITHFLQASATYSFADAGWRPCLRLVV